MVLYVESRAQLSCFTHDCRLDDWGVALTNDVYLAEQSLRLLLSCKGRKEVEHAVALIMDHDAGDARRIITMLTKT